MISERLKPFGTTVFSEMTRLALEHEAINLAQGFPDFDGPSEIIEAAVDALRSGHNQYARSMGVSALTEAISAHQSRCYGLDYDPSREVVVFSGATEGIASSLMGLLNPGDEVILFEPFYDSYPACLAMAGAVPRFCTLRFPEFAVDFDELASLFSPKTRILLLNNPHNPTGKVFSQNELGEIAELCHRHNTLVVTDEVYEHLTYDGAEHVPMARLPGMRGRTLTLSSAGKTYSFTGWKVGWGTGPEPLVAAAQAAHQFVTFATATPLQHAVALALTRFTQEYFDQFRQEYEQRRDFLVRVLRDVGFQVAVPRGTYFILADFTALRDCDDREFARWLIQEAKVAAVPPSAFYREHPEQGQSLIRFAFCKRSETLEESGRRLRSLAGAVSR